MNKTKVSLKFTNLSNLWAFRLAIDVNVFEMNLSELMITCDCTREHIQLATEKFGGRVVELKKETA
jgi:hypothetical protein